MRNFSFRSAQPARSREQARVALRILLLTTSIALVIGAAGDYWWHHSPSAKPRDDAPVSVLAAGTRTVLNHLSAPVEIRFYSLLDPETVPAEVVEFAGRVSQWLAAYEMDGAGHVRVTRFDSRSPESAATASADGLKPFNQDRGEPCYLGIAVFANGRHETLALLAPEWEQALEADLSRTIARVTMAVPETHALAKPTGSEAAVLEAVKRALPDLDKLSLEEGSLRLRQQAREESQAYARETEARAKELEQRFQAAQERGDQAATQSALNELQKLQGEKIARLQDIAAEAQARVDALSELKKQAK